MAAKLFLVGLDRDGTINEDPGYFGKDLDWRGQLVILPGAADGIKKLKSGGTSRVVVATNQAGVARGFYGVDRIEEVNKYIDDVLKSQGACIDAWYSCPYVGMEYAKKRGLAEDNPWVKETDMRKPSIGMLKMAAKDLGVNLDDFLEIYFAGDMKQDVKTGLNANGKGVLVLNGKNNDHYKEVRDELLPQYRGRIFIADSLESAADMILEDARKFV